MPSITGPKKLSGKSGMTARIPGVPQKKEEKDELKMEPITAESLQTEKAFIKISKKHQKDLDAMRKRHQKERTSVQKNQCMAIEKLAKSQKGRCVIHQSLY